MEQKIINDCQVEICSEEEEGHRGILQKTPTDSGPKDLRGENVDQSFIRPVPPENLFKEAVLEEGSVVDVKYKDVWCTGVLIKKLEEENYLVYFDVTPDIVQYERKHLRVHLDWTGSKWVRPEGKEMSKSMFSPATLVEVSCSVVDKVEVSWVSAMIVKEIEECNEKKFVVKFCNKDLRCNGGDEAKPNMVVDSCRVRPTPPPFLVEDYNLLECVEVFRGFSWCQGLVRGILSEKRYMVRVKATKEDLVFQHSELRPFMVWEDGVWHNGPEQEPVKETPFKPMCSSSGVRLMKTPKRATKPEENGETVTNSATGVTSIARESVSPVTQLKQTGANTEKTFETMRNQNGLGYVSPRENDNSEDGSRKRKREEKHNSGLNETDGICNGSEAEINDTGKNICNNGYVDDQPLSMKLSSNQSPNVVDNSAADVEGTQPKDALMILPFAKKLPFWNTYETSEFYKTQPQNPHFSLLIEEKENIREWAAVGMTAAFYGLLDEVKDLQLNVSTSKLSSLSSYFAVLEKYGFNVETAQSRISKVLSLQDRRAKKAEQRKCLEKKIEAEKIERQKFEEEVAELDRKVLELNRQELVAKENKEAADKRIVEMKSYAKTIDQEIKDVELEFQTSASAPW
ncbi:DUF724 domain-containing protein 1 [Cardamine amara subsp. amara]|uniref:DUF724 domain-containing protein 1 n=1 Tax=Cardamine amara subsp. amara TaxID=228776 RepID=A0ABD1BD85_CARAN